MINIIHLAQSTILKKSDLNLPVVAADDSALKKVLTVVFSITTVIAVVYVTRAGLNMVTSQGEPGSVKKARDGIVYGLIGLMISLAALTIVSFFIGKVTG
jgi:hypothetical protein